MTVEDVLNRAFLQPGDFQGDGFVSDDVVGRKGRLQSEEVSGIGHIGLTGLAFVGKSLSYGPCGPFQIRAK